MATGFTKQSESASHSFLKTMEVFQDLAVSMWHQTDNYNFIKQYSAKTSEKY